MPMLIAEGFDVVGVDIGFYEGCDFGSRKSRAMCIRKDVRDIETSDLEGFDAIVHLAALSNDPLGNLNEGLTFEINHKASVRIAKLAREAGVERFVFSSSCSNYGEGGGKMLDEEAEFHPVTPYGVSKVLVEQDVSKLADDAFSPTFLRNATAYGVSPKLRMDLVLNNLVGWAFTTGNIVMQSDGSPWRPIVHVEDISRAFVAVLRAPRNLVHNKAFNVGVTDDNLQIKDIANIVGETVPDCQIKFAKDACADKRCYKVDCTRLKQVLPSFQPMWNACRGAQQLYKEYKKNNLTFDDFNGSKYQRVKRIRYLLETRQLDASLRWKRKN
jgi:nucleoside-diphosphate-sugar epimerase